MRHLFIVNPAAGKKESTERLLTEIEKLRSKVDLEIAMTGAAGDAEKIARRAIEEGEPIRIYACGGDGTLNEVVNAAAGCDYAAITNVPKGTGNDFLKIFGEGWREGFSDLEALMNGPQASFDLIRCGDRLGIGVACAGVDARVAQDVHRFKSLPHVSGMGAYIMALVTNVVMKGINRLMKVSLGSGYRHEGKVALVCVCNGRYYGGGFMPVGEAMPDNGQLDILVVRGVSLLTFARLVKKYATGRYADYPQYIHHWRGDRAELSADEEIVAVVDGELVTGKQLTIGLAEEKVNFFWPACLDYRTEKEQETQKVGTH